jgi:hypothetical protein
MRPGDAWGAPAAGDADVEGAGGDAELAAIARDHPGARVRFVPDDGCDLARAVGLIGRSAGEWEVPVDVLGVGDLIAANMLTLGVPPDRLHRWSRSVAVTATLDDRPFFTGSATSIVVANGQYLRGADVVPRGHPGDGRLEVQVYARAAGERASMRRRLTGGTHVPHPRITTGSGRRVEIHLDPCVPAAIDGRPGPRRATWRVAVVPGALRLLV